MPILSHGYVGHQVEAEREYAKANGLVTKENGLVKKMSEDAESGDDTAGADQQAPPASGPRTNARRAYSVSECTFRLSRLFLSYILIGR